MPAQLKIYDPPVLAEAWESIHLIPLSLIGSIEELRRLLTLIEEELTRFHDQKWKIRFVQLTRGAKGVGRVVVDDHLKVHSRRCHEIENASKFIIEALDETITRLQSRFD